MIMVLIVSFLYAYYKKMKWWAFAIMFYFNYEFYQLSKSRTAFYCGSAAIIAYFILRYARKIYEFKISLILLEIGNLVGIFLSIYYGLYSQLTDPTFMRLDQLITGRLTVARNCFLGAGIPLLRIHHWPVYKFHIHKPFHQCSSKQRNSSSKKTVPCNCPSSCDQLI